MKKQSKQYALLAIIAICFSWILTPLTAQNQKIIFENPDGSNGSMGSYIRPTADGGYLMLGMAHNIFDGPPSFSLPRAIKVNAALQTEWDNTYLNADIGPNGLYSELHSGPLELNEGSFVFGIFDTVTGYDILRIAATGELLWGKDLPGVENQVYPINALPNGDFLATRSHLTTYFTGWKHYVSVFNSNGDLVEDHQIEEVPRINSTILLSGGDVLIGHRLIGHDDQSARVFTRVDPQSNVVWQTAPLAGLTDVISPMPDGGFGVVGKSNSGHFTVHFFDAQGNATGQTPTLVLPISGILSLGFYPDGSFLVAGRTTQLKSFMARFQQDGAEVWSAEAPEDDQSPLQYLVGHPTSDGWGIGTGGKYQNSLESKFGLFRVTENESIFTGVLTGKVGYDSDEDCTLAATETGIAHAQITAFNSIHNFHTFSDADGAYTLIVPPGDYYLSVSVPDNQYTHCSTNSLNVSFPVGANGSIVRDFPMISAPVLHQINGKLRLDQNNNCTAEDDDLPLKHWNVRLSLEDGTGVRHAFTDQNGAYSFTAPEGNYTVVAIPYNQNFSICDPASQSVSVSGVTPQVVTTDFVARAETNCAQMRVSVQSFAVRPCIINSFFVNYRNDGAAPAENATLEVILPPGMTYLNAMPVPTLINGNTLTFLLGEVLPSPGDIWTGIRVWFEGSCDLQIGDELCIVASVTPEEFCGEAPEWNGAIMAIEGECDEDNNAVFTIKNIGNAPNSSPRHMTIIEDQIVLFEDDISLDPMMEYLSPTITPTDDTSTIVVTVEQEPGFPGDDLVVFSLSNCAGTGGDPTGYGGSAGPFSTTKCVPVLNSYDPNDKNASPLGLGEAHSVRLGTPLEYTIRFQNTGNDTAFLVVIRDTLSHHFDTDKIEVLGSSHNYEMALLNENILHFAFKNILLPDSTTNLEASQGYVLFRVYPKADLAQGTVVENNAAIYFDYNEPIITNTVLRTYEDFILVVKTDEARQPQALDVSIYPNPFSTQATFELPEGAPAGDYALELYDAAGRQLRSMSFDGTRCMVTRNALPAGLLFWKISREGRMVASGKMIAE